MIMKEKSLEERLDRTETVAQAGTGVAARLTRRPVLTAGMVLVGAGLAYAAVRFARSNGDSDAEVAREVHFETSIAINRTPEELFAYWRNLKNLPLFMSSLISVRELDSHRSHWVARGVNGTEVKWDAEIYNEKLNELIAWRSVDGDVANAGSVRFTPGPKGRGTYVQVTVNYNPPLGVVGQALGQLLGADPAALIKEDLRQFKQIVEAGEAATIEGQTSGREAAATTTGDTQ
jgi:uncharacterized membrane protein